MKFTKFHLSFIRFETPKPYKLFKEVSPKRRRSRRRRRRRRTAAITTTKTTTRWVAIMSAVPDPKNKSSDIMHADFVMVIFVICCSMVLRQFTNTHPAWRCSDWPSRNDQMRISTGKGYRECDLDECLKNIGEDASSSRQRHSEAPIHTPFDTLPMWRQLDVVRCGVQLYYYVEPTWTCSCRQMELLLHTIWHKT